MSTAQFCAEQNDVAERVHILRALGSMIPGVPSQDINKFVCYTMHGTTIGVAPDAAELLKRRTVSTQYFRHKWVANCLPLCNVRYRWSCTWSRDQPLSLWGWGWGWCWLDREPHQHNRFRIWPAIKRCKRGLLVLVDHP